MERHAHFGKYISRAICDTTEPALARATSSPARRLRMLWIRSSVRVHISLCVSFFHSLPGCYSHTPLRRFDEMIAWPKCSQHLNVSPEKVLP